jgi:GNAT superfamily N-acetyltransferase
MAHIRDRLRRLDEQPRYSGSGGLAMRALVAADLPGCMRLSSTAGWNQTECDWSSFLSANPDTCFGMLHNGFIVGTAAGLAFNAPLAWIGMMLVDPAFRRMGIATRLMRRTMDSLAACASIKLDATPAGRSVYETLGFVAEYDLKRMVCRAVPHVEAPKDLLRPATEADLEQLARFDADAFGAERTGVLRHLLSLAPELAWHVDRDGVTRAACLGRPGTLFTQIGPVIGESLDEAFAVLSAALAAMRSQPVAIDVPEHHPELIEWLRSLGFVEQRPFTRMYFRSNVEGIPGKYFAIAGPELG